MGLEALLLGKTLEEARWAATAGFARPDPPPPNSSQEEVDKYWAFCTEQLSLVQALLIGWHRVRYPSFIRQYEVISTETERRSLLSSNVMLMSREDALLRDRESGQLILLNWKTTSSISDWDKKWHYAVQAWTEALAIESQVGEPVAGCLFEGLYKGVYKNGRQCSDLLYGYRTPLPREESGRWRYSADYQKGSKATPWERFAVWDNDDPTWGSDPLAYWINWLPWDRVSEYFVTSNPVFKDDQITQGWINQVVRLETEIEHLLRPEVSEEEREVYFIQNISDWNCRSCHFKKVCLEKVPLPQLVEEGKLVHRIDHHLQPGEQVDE